MKAEHEQFKGRKISFGKDDCGTLAYFEDQSGTSFRTAGRGDTKDEMTLNLYDNEIERNS